jgi:hypothetical protein
MPAVFPPAALAKLKFVLILRDPVRRLYAYWDTFVLSGTGVNSEASEANPQPSALLSGTGVDSEASPQPPARLSEEATPL